jgi:serine/threonine-protein kinase RsbW
MAHKSTEMDNSMSLRIPSILENIRIIESFIDQAREHFDLNDDIYGNVLIAVTESVNNAIVHGNKADSSKEVHLTLRVEDNRISFIVRDEGEGFDHRKLPDPTAPEALETEGGRGIFLIRCLADEVKFEDQGRSVMMVFYMNA